MDVFDARRSAKVPCRAVILNQVRVEHVFAVADDLTGALEIGGKFAARGIRANVTTNIDGAEAPGVLVVDAQTRHLTPDEARARTEKILFLAREHATELIYKKTDSTLRGNIAAEFRALQNVYRDGRIIYVPAYPDLGRTVVNGQLYVHNTPVHETEFARDRLNPVRDCRVRAAVGDADVLILDGDCNADIHAAAELVFAQAAPRICAGPGALADALADKLAGEMLCVVPELPRMRCCLVVNGSLHPVSTAQIEAAKNQGVFAGGWRLFEECVEGIGVRRAQEVGESVRRELIRQPCDGVILFGGDTAYGVHSVLGLAPYEAIGEVAPGVPISRSPTSLFTNLIWITKAGGFGSPDILASIKRKLT
jgi:uncharacterized protein YgbK (DUF1537 family)